MVAIVFITIQFNVYVFASGLSIYSFLLLFLNLSVCGKPINYGIREQLKDVAPIILKQIFVTIICLLFAWLSLELNIYLRVIGTLAIGCTLLFLLFYKDPFFQMGIKLLPFNKK